MVNSKTKCFFIWYVLCFEKYKDHHKIGLDRWSTGHCNRKKGKKKDRGLLVPLRSLCNIEKQILMRNKYLFLNKE